MKCQECQEAIYAYRELGDGEKKKVEFHIVNCSQCFALFSEMQSVNQLLLKAATANVQPAHPDWLVNKIMREVAHAKSEVDQGALFSLHFFERSVIRYSLAAASIGLMVLFFVEIITPQTGSEKIKGPISNFQGVIVRADVFRKSLSERKEKPSIRNSCVNRLTKQINLACVKEKIEKLNF